jgi:predicted ArsR family transcriptional regulator
VTEPGPSPQTRRAVLDLLKRNGAQTVAQLRAALEVSGVAVRRHLEALEHDGLVRQTTRSAGRGRPAYVYALTTAGHDLFPRNYQQLALQLLEAAGERFGEGAVEQLFRHREETLARAYRARISGRSLPELARELAAMQDENGYMAECEASGAEPGEAPGGDRWLVREHNCAIARVAGAYPSACAHELALFQRLAGPGVQVERVAHMQAGDPVCAYVLRPAAADGLVVGAEQGEADGRARE